MDNIHGIDLLKRELLELASQLLSPHAEMMSKKELKVIQQRITAINFTLSSDRRKIRDIS